MKLKLCQIVVLYKSIHYITFLTYLIGLDYLHSSFSFELVRSTCSTEPTAVFPGSGPAEMALLIPGPASGGSYARLHHDLTSLKHPNQSSIPTALF